MRAILDSGIFIATQYKDDFYSERAMSILKGFKEGKISEIYINNYVLLEVVNFLLRKAFFDRANKAYEFLTKTDNIKLVYVDEVMDGRIKELFEKYKDLSLTDCSLIVLSENYKIKNLFSFDSGFDKVKNIIRKDAFR